MICALCAWLILSAFPVSAAGDFAALAGGTAPSGSIRFIENVGQFDAAVRYQAWGAAGDTWLGDDGEHTAGLTLSFVGADAGAPLEGVGAAAAQLTYVVSGPEPATYQDVPVWAGVRTVDLYPGIDLVVTSVGGQIVRRLVVKGETGEASLAAVRLRVAGAEALAVDGAAVYAETEAGEVILPLLEVVDEDGVELALETSPAVAGDEIAAPFATRAVADATQAATMDAQVQSGGDDLVHGS
jgi:hypothetical protein